MSSCSSTAGPYAARDPPGFIDYRARDGRKAEASRAQPVLLAGDRGDGAAPLAALRGTHRRLRRHGRHGPCPRAGEPADGGAAQRRQDRPCPLDDLRPLAAPAPCDQLCDLPRRDRAHRAPGRGARSRPLYDRPPRGGRHRTADRAQVRRAALRDQPGRLPGDRRAREPARQPARGRNPAPARRPVPPARRPRHRDRRDDEETARGEGRARRESRGHPELGRHDRDHAAAP